MGKILLVVLAMLVFFMASTTVLASLDDPYEEDSNLDTNKEFAVESVIDSSSSLPNTGSDVVELNEKNFEHLTQATTGATTGDWLIKFYAPWCTHCKTLAPIFDRVAFELRGDVNVAKVDCIVNRDLGLRFDIRGFPTVLLLSKGRMYHFKDERRAENLIEFARGTHKIHEGEPIPLPVGGAFTEIVVVLRHAYKEAIKDIKARNYMTYNVALCFMPFVFGVIIFLLLVIPVPRARMPDTKIMPKRFPASPPTVQPNTSMRAAPPTSAKDSSHSNKND